jgi:membrane fusion protein
MLRPAGGVRVLAAEVAGTVANVEARSGDAVRAGAALVTLDAPAVRGQLLEAERQVADVRTRFADGAARQDAHHAEQVERLRARVRRAVEQVESARGSVAYQQRRVGTEAELRRRDLVSELSVAESREALAQAQRQLAAAEAALEQTRQELAAIEARREDDLWQRRQLVTSAESKRDALTLLERQTVVRAPEDGTVEALLVRPGEVVQAGQALGKLIPGGTDLRVVCFLPERDRAFVRPGDPVHLELDQLPYGEFGTLRGRVARIGDDLASPLEVKDALGEQQKVDVPTYRVEVEVTDARAARDAGVRLRSGMLTDVRFTLRRQRLVTLALDPLRRWFR